MGQDSALGAEESTEPYVGHRCDKGTYNYMYELLQKRFEEVGIVSSAVTHAFRRSGARIAQRAGLTNDQIRKIAHWREGCDSIRYVNTQSMEPVLRYAGHSDIKRHFLPRSLVYPQNISAELGNWASKTIFPWADPILKQLKAAKREELDYAGIVFLYTVVHNGRYIVAQDLAVLARLFPHHPYVCNSPFTKHAHFPKYVAEVERYERCKLRHAQLRERMQTNFEKVRNTQTCR